MEKAVPMINAYIYEIQQIFQLPYFNQTQNSWQLSGTLGITIMRQCLLILEYTPQQMVLAGNGNEA